MIANIITISRVFIAFAAMLAMQRGYAEAGAVLIAMSVLLDAVDGPVARYAKTSSDRGARLDILADRITEVSLLVWFAVAGRISVVLPIAVLSRGMTIDFLRARPKAGWMVRGPLGSAVVASRTARGIYGGVKLACFVALALSLPAGRWLAWAVVAMCFLRATPVWLEKLLDGGAWT